MIGHSRTPNPLINFFQGFSAFSKSMKQHSHTFFVEEIKDTIACLSKPKPHLSQPAFDLRRVWMIKCRPMLSEQIDTGENLAANFLRQTIQPLLYWPAADFILEEVDPPAFHSHAVKSSSILSFLISGLHNANDDETSFPFAPYRRNGSGGG